MKTASGVSGLLVRALLAAAVACLPAPSFAAVTSLITGYTHSYDDGSNNDYGRAVRVNSQGVSYVVGDTNSTPKKLFLLQLDSTLTQINSATFSENAITASDLSISPDGNYIYAVGYYNDGTTQNYITLRYDSNLNFISSATYDGGYVDQARSVTVDTDGNILVTGNRQSATSQDIYTIKYSTALTVINSVAYDGGSTDIGYSITTDALNNIYIAGQSVEGSSKFIVLKYNSSLTLISHQTFDIGTIARSIVYDSSTGNLVLTGQGDSSAGYITAIIDTNLNFISSTTYAPGTTNVPFSVALNSGGEIFVTGYSDNNYLTLHYSPALVLISTGVYDGGGQDRSYGIAVDGNSNVIVTGERYDGSSANAYTMLYFGPPTVLTATDARQTATANVIVNGTNFASGISVASGDSGITVNSVVVASPSQLTASMTVDATVPLGRKTLTVINTDGNSGSLTGGLNVVRMQPVVYTGDASFSTIITQGTLSFGIPAFTFSSSVAMTVSIPASIPAMPSGYSGTGISAQISVNPSIAPSAAYTLTFPYRAEDIVGLTEDKLTIAFYDTTESAWSILTTTIDKTNKLLTVTTTKLGIFTVMAQSGYVPPTTDRTDIFVYPNPYKPGSSGNYGDPTMGEGIVFANVPASFKLLVLDVSGETVYTGAQTSTDNKWLWDAKNQGGQPLASGIYFYIVKDAGGTDLKKGKLGVIR